MCRIIVAPLKFAVKHFGFSYFIIHEYSDSIAISKRLCDIYDSSHSTTEPAVYLYTSLVFELTENFS